MNRTALTLLALMTALAGGCTPPPTYTGRNDPYSARQIQFTSGDLQNDTAVSAPIVSRDPSGYLIVTVPIRDTLNQDLIVDYQAQFFDATGAVVERTEWQTATLPANTPYSVRARSTTAAAVNFQITFRYAK
jgi:uncharacterized protein DUF1425